MLLNYEQNVKVNQKKNYLINKYTSGILLIKSNH